MGLEVQFESFTMLTEWDCLKNGEKEYWVDLRLSP